jgi:hypothetical protein
VSTAGLYLILLLLVVAFRRPLLQDPMIRVFINENLNDLGDESQTDET